MIPLHRCRVVLARMVVVIGLGLSPAVLPLCADPADWSFTPVIKKGQEGFTFIGDAAVGVNGSVVVLARRDIVEGVHLFAGGTVTTIAQVNQPLPGTLGTVSGFPRVGTSLRPRFAIDGAGRVIFIATVTGGTLPASTVSRAFRWDKGVITHLLPDNGFEHLLDTMTDDGRWIAERLTGSRLPQFREYVVTDGVTTFASYNFSMAESGCSAYSMEPGHVISPTSMLIVDGTVAQRALSGGRCDRSNSTENWAVRIEGPAGRTVATGIRTFVNTQSGAVQSGTVRPHNYVASANGGVAFMQQNLDPTPRFDKGSFELFISDEGGTRSILKTAPPEGGARFLQNVMHLDPFGRVSFSTLLPSGGTEFFSGPDLARDRVIGPGDRLFGEVAQSISPVQVVGGGNTFRDSRVFLFKYRLRDAAETTGVAVAKKERKPVIFIHGVAGSVLKTGSRYIWPTIAPDDVADLHLVNGPANTEAVDVVRTYDVGGLGVEKMQFYGPFLQHMTQERGYVEFDLEEDRSRMTNFFLLNLPANNQPNLFTFPYDWRRPNASHVATLHAFIQRIRELHGGAKVNLVVHSMGGLVMRRYLLEYGTESVHGVVTVGSPIWGAPESAFRMFTGIFFGVGPIDFINSSAMKASVLSMPGVHELNPSSKYLQHWGFPVFTEIGADYNDNGIKDEGYNASEFRVALDEEAAPQTPAINNISFHGYLGGRQDDWSQDDDSVRFLHIIGKQAVDVTTVGIEVRARTFSLLGLLGSPSGLQVFSRVVGEGDGTVPTLGSQRLPQYYAPGTLVREITEPLPGVLSAKQPAGRGAEHTMLMSNTNVWNLINEFLDTGTLTTPAAAADGGPTLLAAQSKARKQVLVMGCSLVTIRDAQSVSNKVYSGIAVRQIPGVDVTYDSQENWVLVKFDANRDLVVESAAGCAAVEIEVQEFDLVGDPVGLHRYRIVAGTNRWQLALAGNEVPVLAKDADGDGTFEPEEEIAPSHAASGPNTDVHPPDMEVLLSRVNGQIQLIVNGSDAQSPPVTIRYRLNGGPVATYTGAILFAGDSQHTIALFAEDALGHTSGLIQTRLNPELKIGRLAEAFLALEWPKADGYRLESAPGPQGPWRAVTATRLETNGVVKVTTPASGVATLFRLKR